jgi:drug/metabolite transporter (DMT)-like permease
MILVGVVLMVWSYFYGAAPWCATGVECSNPRIEWTPGLFVLGVLLSFSSALYYSIARDREE